MHLPFDVDISRGSVLEFLHARLEATVVLIGRLDVVLSIFCPRDPMYLLQRALEERVGIGF